MCGRPLHTIPDVAAVVAAVCCAVVSYVIRRRRGAFFGAVLDIDSRSHFSESYSTRRGRGRTHRFVGRTEMSTIGRFCMRAASHAAVSPACRCHASPATSRPDVSSNHLMPSTPLHASPLSSPRSPVCSGVRRPFTSRLGMATRTPRRCLSRRARM